MKQLSLLALCAFLCPVTAFCAGLTNETLQTITARTSIRSYQAKPVEQDKITAILKAAMCAPSAINRQPWEFVVVRDAALRKKLAEVAPNARYVAQAPLAIIVCGNEDRFIAGAGRDFWMLDAAAASQNILLAAKSLGLGSVWCGLYPDKTRSKKVAEVLALPRNVIPLNIIVIGYPEKDQAPKDKWNESRVHYDRW